MGRWIVTMASIVLLASVQHGAEGQELCVEHAVLETTTCVSSTDDSDYEIEVTEEVDGTVVVVVAGPPAPTYVAVGTLPGGGLCWWLSTSESDAVHDPDGGGITRYYQDLIRNNNPQCPFTADDLRLIESTYASIALPLPSVVTTPETIGITGIPMTVAPTSPPPTLTATTPPLSSGITATITASPLDVAVEWGDGGFDKVSPGDVTSHIYELKTCPPDYRTQHLRGHLCHPALEAYPIDVTYRWAGVATAPWGSLDLGIRSTSARLVRDVDEIIGVITR